MIDTILTQNDLETLIERYFEAETSESEEALLRNSLMQGNYRLTPQVREALAVMSLSAYSAGRRRRHRSFYSIAGIAASLAIIVSVALHVHHARNAGMCEMYIAGVQVSDRVAVMKAIEADLKELSDASAASDDVIGCELSEFMDLVTSDAY